MFEEFYMENLQSDLISTEKYKAYCKECPTCYYFNSSLIFRSDYYDSVFVPKLGKSKIPPGKNTLVMGHSDQRIRLFVYLYARRLGFNSVWSVNASNFNPVINSIPIGLTNFKKDSEIHRILGDASLITEALKYDKDATYQGSIYANFTIDYARNQRHKIKKILDILQIEISNPNFSTSGRLDYLKNCRKSNFVLCPVGNGVDTHRIWETLYVGGIPIIKSHTVLNKLVIDLPVLVISDWNQIKNRNFLERSYEELKRGVYDYSKLSSTYWINKFCKSSE